MVTIQVLGRKGHEEFKDLTVEEAEQLINEIEEAGGQRYFIADKKTQKVLKELVLQEDQEIVLIPRVAGGSESASRGKKP